MFWRDSTEYLYEYRTPQGKLNLIIEDVLTRIIAAAGLCIILYSLYVIILEPLAVQFANAGMSSFNRGFMARNPGWSLILWAIVLAILAALAAIVYNPKLILPYGSTSLVVRISQEEIFIRKLVGAGMYHAAYRERIPIAQIKSADVKLYEESEFDHLWQSFMYNEKGYLRWSANPLRSAFMDHSSRECGIAHCAVLEFIDGKQLFIEFKGADEFVAVLNNLRGVTTEVISA